MWQTKIATTMVIKQQCRNKMLLDDDKFTMNCKSKILKTNVTQTRVNQPLDWSFFQQNFIITGSRSQDTDFEPHPLIANTCFKPIQANDVLQGTATQMTTNDVQQKYHIQFQPWQWCLTVTVWHSGNGVALCLAQLVLEWVSVFNWENQSVEPIATSCSSVENE